MLSLMVRFMAKMTSAARWRKLAGQALLNSLPNTPYNPPKELLPDPTLSPSWGERLRDIFPAGFESNSNSIKRDHFTFTPYYLHDILTRNSANNGHVEQTIVKSAWYGKQTRSTARHEFIVLQVEDLAIPGLQNFIALDRNQSSETTSPQGGVAKVSTVSSGTDAADAFRVSYDGDLDRFLHKCKLTPYLELERIEFPSDKALRLLDLVTLVLHVSDQHPQYKALDTNCYWFTGLIWECMREMRPTAAHQVCLAGKRGRIGFVRCIPNRVQVRNVVREAYRRHVRVLKLLSLALN